jgi:hypothetical protein
VRTTSRCPFLARRVREKREFWFQRVRTAIVLKTLLVTGSMCDIEFFRQLMALLPLFDSGGSQFNREAAVAIEVGDPANDSWFVEFNRDMYSASQ